MKRSLISALASLLLTVDVRAAEPRWTVEFKEGAYTFLTATGLEVGQKTVSGAIAGYLVVKLTADVDPATTNRGVFLGRVRVPERRVAWLKGDEFAAGELLPAHHLIAITPNAGFEPGLWAVKVRDSVKDRSGRPVNPTNATWTVEIGEPRARPDDSGPARNTLKLKFTTEVDPATYADGIVVEKQVAGGWEEEPRGSATIAPGRPCGYYADRIDDYLVETAKLRRDQTGVPLAIDRLLLSPVTGFLRLGEAEGRLGYRYAEALKNPRVALPPGATVTSETNQLGGDLLQAAGDAALLAPITRSLAAGAKVSLGAAEGSVIASPARVPLALQAPKALPALPAASVESAIASSYQQFVNEAAQAVVVSFNRGEIPIPAGMSWQTILGQRIDAAARTRLRDFVRSLGVPEGPGTDVLINRRLPDPTGSGRFRIPDLRLVKSRRILDGTIGVKDSSSSQVQDFEMFSLGDTVEIVRPQVGPLQVPR